ncbi:MAG: GHMP kinase [Candidatus Nezhaarchaeota archaeon]|nr:GHMP kinase [Candidatus Nezhaarchaeota archaeon]
MRLGAAVSTSGLVKRAFEEAYGHRPEVVSSAPGRLDFLNTHQDYKGLPVVSVAISKRTYVALAKSTGKCRVFSLNLCLEGASCRDEFEAGSPTLRRDGSFGDYVRSVVYALKEKGLEVRGFDALVYSDVPIASGLASSAALQVALATGLSELYGLGLSRREVAELAYHSEHDVMGIPCGRLDQYGSAMGGLTLIETRPPYSTRTYTGRGWVFVVLHSGVKHRTAEVHLRRIGEVEEGLRGLLKLSIPRGLREKLSERVDGVMWDKVSLEELEPYLGQLDPSSRNRIVFTLKMNQSTMLALRLLEGSASPAERRRVREFLLAEGPECLEAPSRAGDEVLELVAGIVNYQHVLLRDLYEVSLPELEAIRSTALSAGALGVKISGAGLGGSLLAIVSSAREAEEVASACRGVARGSWVVEVDEGARVDFSEARSLLDGAPRPSFPRGK